MEKNLKEWIQEQVRLFRIRTRTLPERELYSLRTESSMLAAIRAYPVQALGRLDKNSLTPRAWAALASKSPAILEQYANIPAEAQVAVVKAVPSALRHLSARSIVTEQAYIEAVRREPSLIGLVRNPSPELQMEAYNKSPETLYQIKSPCRALQLAAVSRDPSSIRMFKDTLEPAVQLAAVSRMPESILLLDTPCKEAVDAVSGNKELMDKLKEKQLESVARNPYILPFMYTPFPDVYRKALEQEFGPLPENIPAESLKEAASFCYAETDRLLEPSPADYTPYEYQVFEDKNQIGDYRKYLWESGSVSRLRTFETITGVKVNPEAYLDTRRREILQRFAKNPAGSIDYYNVSPEGMERWAKAVREYNIMLKAAGKMPMEYGHFDTVFRFADGSALAVRNNRKIDMTAAVDSMYRHGITPSKITKEQWKSLLSGKQTSLGGRSGLFALVQGPAGYALKAVNTVNSLTKSAGMEM